jgi:hypothetical protein
VLPAVICGSLPVGDVDRFVFTTAQDDIRVTCAVPPPGVSYSISPAPTFSGTSVGNLCNTSGHQSNYVASTYILRLTADAAGSNPYPVVVSLP